MPANIILGLQWGDEGKGKLVDILAQSHDMVCRFQGGPNAGHTIVIAGQKFVLHQIPSGIFHEGRLCVIGNGVVLNPITLQNEIQQLVQAGFRPHERLVVSTRAHFILPSHTLLDAASEASKGERKIGSTLRGISPCYQDKYARVGLRVGDLLHPGFDEKLETLLDRHQRLLDWMAPGQFNAREQVAEFRAACAEFKRFQIAETEILVGEALRSGKRVLLEGAQGTLLDIDFGAYPYVTSSHTIAGGACIGLGCAPNVMEQVIGVFKAYCTRVGNGPFPTELQGDAAENLRKAGNEFGATTGRPRRVGWLDLPALRYAILLNGVTSLSIMKVDVLNGFPEVLLCTHYMRNGQRLDYLPADQEEADLQPVYRAFPGWKSCVSGEPLPEELENYLRFVEQELGVPIRFVSMGPGREALMERTPMDVVHEGSH